MADKSLLAHFGIKKNNQVNRLMTEELLGDDLLLHTAKNKIIEQIISLKIDQLNQQEINRILNEYKLSKVEKSYLYNIIDAEINNYGPLTELMNNDNVKEILVNGKDDIYAEIDGQIIKQENIYFINDNHIIRLIERLLKSVNKTLNNYIINVKLKNGYKLNAILPPIATNGPILTIKKNIEKTLDIEDMLRSGTLTPYMARFLEAAVLAKLNILICGNVGSGKTSLLNALANLIPGDERVITIEENREIKLNSPFVVSLEVSNEVNVKELISNALNMRPDRLIIGEIRGEEAFNAIQALNIGLEGMITTIYANSPEEAISRLETYVLASGKEKLKQVIREYIINTIDLIVQIERLSDGKRKIINICEISKDYENEIKLKNIFAFNKKEITDKNHVMGEFVLYKYIPLCYKKMKIRGINTLTDIFDE